MGNGSFLLTKNSINWIDPLPATGLPIMSILQTSRLTIRSYAARSFPVFERMPAYTCTTPPSVFEPPTARLPHVTFQSNRKVPETCPDSEKPSGYAAQQWYSKEVEEKTGRQRLAAAYVALVAPFVHIATVINRPATSSPPIRFIFRCFNCTTRLSVVFYGFTTRC